MAGTAVAIQADNLPSADVGDATAETQFLDTQATAVRMQLKLPSGGAYKNRQFVVRVGGRAIGGTAGNFTANLDFGLSATIATNTTIASTGADDLNVTTSRGWGIEATLFWDGTGNTLSGFDRSYTGDIYNATATIDAIPTSADPTDDGGYGFTVTALFSATDSSNSAFVDYFSVTPL